MVQQARFLRLFQSTPPVKAATRNEKERTPFTDISIHAAREGGDVNNMKNIHEIAISIHAAREGGDDFHLFAVVHQDISIHAAREGGDCGNV